MSKPLSNKLVDLQDKLYDVRSLNEAIFMAAAGIGDRNHTEAIQTVVDIIEKKLIELSDDLEAIREELK